MSNIILNTKDFDNKFNTFVLKIKKLSIEATRTIADEILRLSQFEVPHDIGLLQNSGQTEPEEGGTIVGYNKVYAARLHEHPEYNFQKGRKGKYLEDPIKNNMSVFTEIAGKRIDGGL